MAYCGKCLHLDVCKTAETCDGHVPRCKHFMDKSGVALASCRLGAKGCFFDGKCRYSKPCNNKVVTNADRYRAMTDEELAKMRTRYNDYFGEYETDVGRFESYEDALSAELKWLQQPAEEI